jgi:hypothetical protein
LLKISQFFGFHSSLKFSLIMQTQRVIWHWCKPSGRRRETCWMFESLRGLSCLQQNLIGIYFAVFHTFLKNKVLYKCYRKSDLQIRMNGHIRIKTTWELALTAHHVYILNKSEKLGAFAKLRKATISFAMIVCPSAWNSAANEQISYIWVLFRKSVEKIQVSFRSDKNNGYLH